MDLKTITTQFVDWDAVEGIVSNGESGTTLSKEIHVNSSRIRLSEYSANYKSAKWCEKGHIVHCVEGKIVIHLKNGDEYTLCPGNSLILSEDDHHIATTGVSPAKIFVVD
jgi:mannose-6-phosphate isomerase class I